MTDPQQQRPAVGSLVHYVSHGSPLRADGTQEFTSQCRAATVTEIERTSLGGERVGLCVVNPTGFFFHSLADGGSVQREAEHHGGSWHWPEA